MMTENDALVFALIITLVFLFGIGVGRVSKN